MKFFKLSKVFKSYDNIYKSVIIYFKYNLIYIGVKFVVKGYCFFILF